MGLETRTAWGTLRFGTTAGHPFDKVSHATDDEDEGIFDESDGEEATEKPAVAPSSWVIAPKEEEASSGSEEESQTSVKKPLNWFEKMAEKAKKNLQESSSKGSLSEGAEEGWGKERAALLRRIEELERRLESKTNSTG